MSLFDLTGKVAVVTGGSRGIGRAICERMAEQGAKVVVSSRKIDACQEVVDAIKAKGGEAMAIACNIGRKNECQALIDQTIAAWGQVDIMVCNAAINPHFGPAVTMPDEIFDKIMASNIKSNLWLSHMTAPGMAERGGGSIIIISSIGGFRGSPVLGAYAISKAADMQLVRNLAVEWGPKNVRANAIAPGLVRTDFARALWEDPGIYAKRTKDDPGDKARAMKQHVGSLVRLSTGSGEILGHPGMIEAGSGAGDHFPGVSRWENGGASMRHQGNRGQLGKVRLRRMDRCQSTSEVFESRVALELLRNCAARRCGWRPAARAAVDVDWRFAEWALVPDQTRKHVDPA